MEQQLKYSIGITTYIKRFDQYFKPLLSSIKSIRPDVEVIVTVNGEHNQPFDSNYRKNMLNYVAEQNNCFPIIYPTFRSLSKLWNDCLVNSSNHHVLILNDDLTVTSDFFNNLEKFLNSPYYLKAQNKSFKINNSWSHAFFNRQEIEQCGFFDESFLSIGEEDAEMALSYEKVFGQNTFKNIMLNGIYNHIDQNNCILGQRKVHTKYSMFNHERFLDRFKRVEKNGQPAPWDRSELFEEVKAKPNQRPSERFYWENISKL
jgi:hypothetical protein